MNRPEPRKLGECRHCGAEVWAEYPDGKMEIVWRNDGATGCNHAIDAVERDGKDGDRK